MHKGHIAVGSVEGTGSAINVSVGFTPTYVKLFNYDDAGSIFATAEWWSGMTAGHALLTKSIADNGATGNLSSGKITSGGISEYAGVAGSAAKGFTIGTNADLNASAETIFYIAISGDA